MTPKEQIQKIKEIYDEAINKLKLLNEERSSLIKERKDIIRTYIKDLENKKMDALRTSIELSNNK
ncbi:MAG: hypothetical protein WCW65_00025 [Candidatus Paceibacterota bacterium]